LYSAKDNHFQLAELRIHHVVQMAGPACKQLLIEMILAEYRPVRVQCRRSDLEKALPTSKEVIKNAPVEGLF
jgi:hypothetical protein